MTETPMTEVRRNTRKDILIYVTLAAAAVRMGRVLEVDMIRASEPAQSVGVIEPTGSRLKVELLSEIHTDSPPWFTWRSR